MTRDITARLTELLLGGGGGDDYAKALASCQIEHGWNHRDMTPDQVARFRALNRAWGSATDAKRLIFGQRQYRTKAMNDDKR